MSEGYQQEIQQWMFKPLFLYLYSICIHNCIIATNIAINIIRKITTVAHKILHIFASVEAFCTAQQIYIIILYVFIFIVI